MKRDKFKPAPPRHFASNKVVLLLGGAVMTTAVLASIDWDSEDPPEPEPNSQARVVSQAELAQHLRQDRDEENNSFVPGLGYYHALHHSWFPYPFDYYYPGHGFYRGGAWFNGSYSGPAVPARSKPHWQTVTDDRPQIANPNTPSGARGFTGSGFRGSSSHEGGISRGGFTAPHSSGFHASGHFGGS